MLILRSTIFEDNNIEAKSATTFSFKRFSCSSLLTGTLCRQEVVNESSSVSVLRSSSVSVLRSSLLLINSVLKG